MEEKESFSEQRSNTNFDNMLESLNKIDCIKNLEDDEILKLKEKLKEVELKLKKKAKPKTITISGEAHNMIKNHCLDLNESIGEWSEKILINNIGNTKFISIIEDNITIGGTLPKILPTNHIYKYVETQALPLFSLNYSIDDIFNPYFIKFVTGWAKKEQGNLLGRYEYNLPGGVKINYNEMISDGEKEMKEVTDEIKLILKKDIILIDSLTINMGYYGGSFNTTSSCGVVECYNMEEFLNMESIKNKTIYLYSIGRRSDGIKMSRETANLKIRFIAHP